MPLFLTSLTFTGLADWLRPRRVDAPLALIDHASRALDDHDAIVGMAESELAAQGLAAHRLDRLDTVDFTAFGAIVMTGGDPFRLLAELRASGADRAIADAHHRGIPIAGQSAGAIVCGPSLEPVRITSPFTAPPALDLAGLRLTDTLVLPHHDRPGRADLHRQAAMAFGERLSLYALWDDEALLLDGDAWHIARGPGRTRRVTHADARAVAELFHAASAQAWAGFIGADRLAARDDIDVWSQRITLGGHRFLVTEDDRGLTGFVAYHPAPGDEPAGGAPAGEVDMLYTHPRVWGAGIGRRLLERATWNLLCEGFRTAVLWTEERNERARAVYRAGGWTPDGAVDERDYLGVPIRNLRHRLDLTRHAGGG